MNKPLPCKSIKSQELQVTALKPFAITDNQQALY